MTKKMPTPLNYASKDYKSMGGVPGAAGDIDGLLPRDLNYNSSQGLGQAQDKQTSMVK